MSEFVEASLERLIPVFELLQTIGLFSKIEVKRFVKRCRNFEYRLQKTRKDPNDFLLYADYLHGALKLVRLRRKLLNYKMKNSEVVKPMKAKIAFLYKTVTSRFPGRRYLWRKMIDFLREEKMRIGCSETYFRVLQVVLGNDIQLRVEGALWEFEQNNSIDNARLHLQMGLRLAPEAASLWICFLKIEIMNVQRLMERKKVLTGEEGKKSTGTALFNDEEEESDKRNEDSFKDSDPVMNFKLAEIVVDHALQNPAIKDKKGLLLEMWRCTFCFKEVAQQLEKDTYNRLWLPGQVCEESWIACYERTTDQDPYGILDEACEHFDTEKMLRYYIELGFFRNYCFIYSILLTFRIAQFFSDIYATIKLKELLSRLHRKGFAQIEDYKKLLSYGEDQEEKIQFVEAALEWFPSSSFLWTELIKLKMAQNTNIKEVELLFNEAETKVELKEILPLYQLAIDWAIANVPSKVDAVFERAMLVSCPEVSSEIRCIRLKYCKAAFPNDPSVFREEYRKLYSSPPNSRKFYETYIELERKIMVPDNKRIRSAFEDYVTDLGTTDYNCWIEYAKYLLTVDPSARASACIPKAESDSFTEAWVVMLRESQPSNVEQAQKSAARN
ncbi:unnamed protein product [Enterobius vermicularis]|uniref:U3 small nucleolar RNA-associated protein 6 homolog n=1 Tax=Enterobius vermicularis TaxID=51028 RepID=A0A0N4VIR1_ENTVE|nr:unnamed protein product [Enterobius vermicularis]